MKVFGMRGNPPVMYSAEVPEGAAILGVGQPYRLASEITSIDEERRTFTTSARPGVEKPWPKGAVLDSDIDWKPVTP